MENKKTKNKKYKKYRDIFKKIERFLSPQKLPLDAIGYFMDENGNVTKLNQFNY